MEDEIKIVPERVTLDDNALVSLFKKLKKEVAVKKANYELNKLTSEQDYLSFRVAWLAYAFAKEDCEKLDYEVKKRGLMIS